MSDDNIDQPAAAAPQLPPAGWYPDPHESAAQRYWDGFQWTENRSASQTDAASPTHAAPAHSAVSIATSSPAGADGGAVATRSRRGLPTLRWWQWALIAVAATVLVIIIVNGVNGVNGGRASSDAEPTRAAAGAAPSAEKVTPAPVEVVEVPEMIGSTVAEARAMLAAVGLVLTTTEAGDDWVITAQQPRAGSHPIDGLELSVTSEVPKPVYTLAQQNALEAAQSYLEYSSFSRQGLIDQLSSEYGSGFPVDVSTWAADTAGADWDAEAVEAAQSYLDYSSFSRDGLFDQLTSAYGSQFTPEQAEYALVAVGY